MVWIYSAALIAGASGWSLVAAVFPAAPAFFALVPAGPARRRWAAVVGLCACCYACGAASHARFESGHRRLQALSKRYGGRALRLEGRVTDFPSDRPGGVRFRFSTAVGGRPVTLLASATAFGIDYGDRLAMVGRVTTGRPDRRGYLHSKGASGHVRARAGDVEELGPGGAPPWSPGRVAWRFHEGIRRRLAANLGARSGLPSALTIGERGRIPRNLTAAFRRLGVSHLLALSGMHLGMIAAAALGILRLTGRRDRWLVLTVLAAYVLVVGRVVSLYRAYALAVVVAVSSKTERPVKAVHSLGVALFALLAAQPGLVHSVAFQLSFSATLGVLVGASRIRVGATGGRLARTAAATASALGVGAAAQLFLVPLQLRYFGGLTAFTPVATLLLLPAVAGVMLLTGVALLFDVAAPPLAPPAFATLAWVVGGLERGVLWTAARAPAPVELPAPHPVVYYVALAVCIKIFDSVFRRPVI